MRATISSAAAPTAAQAACRVTKYQEDPCSSRATTDDADITITSPSRLKTVMRNARARNIPEPVALVGGGGAVGWRRRARGSGRGRGRFRTAVVTPAPLVPRLWVSRPGGRGDGLQDRTP